MANHFSFTQIKAPDLSTSATLLRNANDSFQGALDSVSAGADLYRDANIAQDTNLRVTNTQNWQRKINAAQTPEELAMISQEIGSDDFAKSYGGDRLIDTAKLTEALSAQPAAIVTRKENLLKIDSSDQSEQLSGFEGQIASASSPEEVANIMKAVTAKGLTPANVAKLSKASSNRIGDLNSIAATASATTNANSNLLRNQILTRGEEDRRKLDTQKSNVNESLTNQLESSFSQWLTEPTEGFMQTQILETTNDLVQKTGAPRAVVEGIVKARMADYYKANSTRNGEHLKTMVGADLASKGMLAKASAEGGKAEDIQREVSAITQEKYSTIMDAEINPSTNPAATPTEINAFMETMKEADIDISEYAKLPRQLVSSYMLQQLSASSDTEDFNDKVAKTIVDYGDYVRQKATLAPAANRAIKDSKRLMGNLRDDLTKTEEKMALAQYKYDQASTGEERDAANAELARLRESYNSTADAIVNFKSPSLREYLKFDPVTIDDRNTGLRKLMSRGGKTSDIRNSLIGLQQLYGVADEDLSADAGTHIMVSGLYGEEVALPLKLANTLREAAALVDKRQVKAEKEAKKKLANPKTPTVPESVSALKVSPEQRAKLTELRRAATGRGAQQKAREAYADYLKEVTEQEAAYKAATQAEAIKRSRSSRGNGIGAFGNN